MAEHYTTADIKLIRELAKTMPAKMVAEKFERTIGGIYLIAFRHGIRFRPSTRNRYTSKDRARVIELRRQGMQYRQIEAETGVKMQSCMYFCKGLQLPSE